MHTTHPLGLLRHLNTDSSEREIDRERERRNGCSKNDLLFALFRVKVVPSIRPLEPKQSELTWQASRWS